MDKTRKKSLFIKIMLPFVMLAFYTISAKGQINYVQNPSFEVYDTCPNTLHQIRYALYWSNLIDHSGLTPDFMHACANPNADVGVPVNSSYQMPLTGLGYARVGLFSYSTSTPNFMQAEAMNNKLSKPLTANKQYCVKAHLSLYDNSFCVVDGFGMYFDNGTYSVFTSGQITPQIEILDYNYLSDTVGWMEISGTFIADGTEEYITLGNFKRLQTHYLPTANDPGTGYYEAFYYIDDVSVIESDLPAFAGNDTLVLNIGDSIYIGRQPEIGLECIWYDLQGQEIGTGAGMWVFPTHATSYIVQQNLCGNLSSDTVVVYVGTMGLVESSDLWEVKIAPNPTSENIRLWVNQKEDFTLEIQDIQGKTVETTYHHALKGEVMIKNNLTSGIYFIRLTNLKTNEQQTQKVIIY